MKKVIVRVPATSANLGPGFDSLGMALELYNEIVIEQSEKPLIHVIGEGADDIPRTEENIVYRSALEVLKTAGKRGELPDRKRNFSILLRNRIPSTRGLGSSSSAVVGGVLGMNSLLGNPLSTREMLRIAVKLEGHPDNALPAFFGGLVASTVDESGEVLWRKQLLPEEWRYIVVIPSSRLSTARAREILPESVPMKDAVFNLSRLSLLIMGFEAGDYALVAKVMRDRVHEEHRASFIAGLSRAIHLSRGLGAPVALSGAGPTVLGIGKNMDHALSLADRMKEIFREQKIEAEVIILKGNRNGASVESVD